MVPLQLRVLEARLGDSLVRSEAIFSGEDVERGDESPQAERNPDFER